MDSVAVILAVFGSLHGLIDHAVSLPACIKGFYVTLLHQVRMCFCGHCNPRQAEF